MSGNSHIEEKAEDAGSEKNEAALGSRKQKAIGSFSGAGLQAGVGPAIFLVHPLKMQYTRMGGAGTWAQRGTCPEPLTGEGLCM